MLIIEIVIALIERAIDAAFELMGRLVAEPAMDVL